MDRHEDRAVALRADIERIKSALLITTDEPARGDLHMRLNACIRESLALIDQRLQAYWARQTVPEEPLRERHTDEPL
jgi:hypothetical protein